MVQETRTGDYMSVLTLTVRELRGQDFGGYICASVNALGKAEGGIRLQGGLSCHHIFIILCMYITIHKIFTYF